MYFTKIVDFFSKTYLGEAPGENGVVEAVVA